MHICAQIQSCYNGFCIIKANKQRKLQIKKENKNDDKQLGEQRNKKGCERKREIVMNRQHQYERKKHVITRRPSMPNKS